MWCVFLCVFVLVYICICACLCVFVCTCMCFACAGVFAIVFYCVSVCVCDRVCMFSCVCQFAHLHTNDRIYVYIYTFIRTYTQKNTPKIYAHLPITQFPPAVQNKQRIISLSVEEERTTQSAVSNGRSVLFPFSKDLKDDRLLFFFTFFCIWRFLFFIFLFFSMYNRNRLLVRRRFRVFIADSHGKKRKKK